MTAAASARRTWYLDSSVALYILLAQSEHAARWFDERAEAGDDLVSSQLLVLEIVRALRRESLDVALGHEFVDELTLLGVDNALIGEAAAIRPHVRSLDALHLASVQRLGAGSATVVTHDATMARVADGLGFDVYDPIV
ncbi:type II toxin-antitoxin system VapC family toxin [Gordonia sp. (in: high G+C Gram-positive bacteria)]|uniref:type II toxin-antitoxin system VapC family toxin n=1 Tax=Gordonia sp. (in: high G+C Gram-positive bacteria) TaxID=84139 RepID=UPI0039E6B6CC